jgi:hypothetical protein
MMVLASSCGDTHVDLTTIAHVRSEMGFDVCGIVLPPNPAKSKRRFSKKRNVPYK